MTTHSLFYTYGIINDKNSAPALHDMKGFGETELVVFQDLAAVVSKVSSNQFSQHEIDRRIKDSVGSQTQPLDMREYWKKSCVQRHRFR